MKRLRLHDEAEAELSEIFFYYAEMDEDLAIRFYQKISESFSQIIRQPKIGTPIEEPTENISLKAFIISSFTRKREKPLK